MKFKPGDKVHIEFKGTIHPNSREDESLYVDIGGWAIAVPEYLVKHVSEEDEMPAEQPEPAYWTDEWTVRIRGKPTYYMQTEQAAIERAQEYVKLGYNEAVVTHIRTRRVVTFRAKREIVEARP